MIVEAPTIEVVNQGGEPVWRVSGLGMSVCDRCGARARELWHQLGDRQSPQLHGHGQHVGRAAGLQGTLPALQLQLSL
jgi:hypothetical protein